MKGFRKPPCTAPPKNTYSVDEADRVAFVLRHEAAAAAETTEHGFRKVVTHAVLA